MTLHLERAFVGLAMFKCYMQRIAVLILELCMAFLHHHDDDINYTCSDTAAKVDQEQESTAKASAYPFKLKVMYKAIASVTFLS